MNLNQQPLWYTEMESLVGPLVIVKTYRGICYIEFGTWQEHHDHIHVWADRWIGQVLFIEDVLQLQDAVEQITQYFRQQRRDFAIALDLRGTSFQCIVWHALTKIPYGTTRSYTDIAISIDAPKAVRAVGGANNKNPLPIIVPCHRVIGANGSLIGYDGGIWIKQKLLLLESSDS
jgi:O-6-methylguanine DNA methyltransferase